MHEAIAERPAKATTPSCFAPPSSAGSSRFVDLRSTTKDTCEPALRRRISHIAMTPVGFEPTPLQNGALNHRRRPLRQSVHARKPPQKLPDFTTPLAAASRRAPVGMGSSHRATVPPHGPSASVGTLLAPRLRELMEGSKQDRNPSYQEA